MRTVFSTAKRQATQLTCEQNVIEATRLIQRALGRGHALSPDEQSRESSRSIELQARGSPDLRPLQSCPEGFNRSAVVEDLR